MILAPISSLSAVNQSSAKAIADKYGFEYSSSDKQCSSNRFLLQLSEDHLQLSDSKNNSFAPLIIDFTAGKSAHRRLYGGGKSQLLGKAVGLNKGFKPFIIDATAGLGQDSFVLACLGCKVVMYERSAVLAAMLEYALLSASRNQEIKDIIKNISLLHCDSIVKLCSKNPLPEQADIIYLDPMFPDKKGSALVKKEMQYLQHLIGKDVDSAQLLSCAIEQAKYRVVVKRPAKAPYLDGQKPQLELSSKKQRFDIYIKQKLPL